MNHNVIRRVEPLASEFVGDHRDGSVVFVTRHAAVAVLAGKLPPLEVEGVAVAVAGRIAEHRDPPVLLRPAHLNVVGDVAPHQIPADPIPSRTLRPQRARVDPFDRRVADHVLLKAIVHSHDVGVGIAYGRLPGPVAQCCGRSSGCLLGPGGEGCRSAESCCQKRPAVTLGHSVRDYIRLSLLLSEVSDSIGPVSDSHLTPPAVRFHFVRVSVSSTFPSRPCP